MYYTVRKDKGPAVEKVKIFSGSRGELTDQPPESGHYTFTFTQLSDANYKRVDLKGPTIDQVIHPQATADFAHNVAGVRGRKKFSNCEGNTTKLDVDLKVCFHDLNRSPIFIEFLLGYRSMDALCSGGGTKGF